MKIGRSYTCTEVIYLTNPNLAAKSIRNSIRNFEAEILWKNKELQAQSKVKVPYKKKTCTLGVQTFASRNFREVENSRNLRHLLSRI